MDGSQEEEGMGGQEDAPMLVPGGLTELRVNLPPAAYTALLEAVKITGDSKTDTVVRALQLHAFLEARKAEGWQPALMRDGRVKTFDLSA